jgi:peptidoglycan hydrolase-like protein with peptidoglycan-binding domain
VSGLATPTAATASRAAASGAPAAGSPASTPAAPSGSPADRTAAGPTDPSGVLRAGDAGPAVVRLQQLLFAQGKTYVAADGRYDAATERAVREVQQERSITADPSGVYGAATRAALEGS